jgi:molecular chaperone DnaK
MYQSEKTLRDVGDKVSADVKSDVESKLADVRAALATDDVERIRSSKDALQTAMLKVGEQLYAAAGAAGGAPSDGDGAEGAAPETDNTVEGEFKEM